MTSIEAAKPCPEPGTDGSDEQPAPSSARPLNVTGTFEYGGPIFVARRTDPAGSGPSEAAGAPSMADAPETALAPEDEILTERTASDSGRPPFGMGTPSIDRQRAAPAPGDPAAAADRAPVAGPKFSKTQVEAQRLAAAMGTITSAPEDEQPWHLRPLSTEEATATRFGWLPFPGRGDAGGEARSPLWRRAALLAGVTVIGAAVGGGLSQGLRGLWSAVPSFAGDPPDVDQHRPDAEMIPAGTDDPVDDSPSAATATALAGLEANAPLSREPAGGPLIDFDPKTRSVGTGQPSGAAQAATAGVTATDDAQASFARAVAARQAGDLELAGRLYEAAAAVNPGQAVVFYDWGYVLQLQGDLDAALEKYTRAIEIDPAHAHAYYNRGYLLQLRGRFIDAIDNYRSASEADGRNPYIFLSWGASLEKIGKPARARELYRITIAVAPDSQAAVDAKARLAALDHLEASNPALTTASVK